jgi:ABC-type nitrate/sulfonate/bicarbonate transport system substrate-binding protein
VVLLALISACSSGSSGAGSPSGGSGAKTVVNVGWATYPSSPQIANGAGYMAKDLAAAGATTTWSTFDTGAALATAFLSNKIDIVTSVTAVPMVPLIANSVPFKIFYVTDSSVSDDEIVAKDSIHSMKDLVGQKVTYTSGTGQQYAFDTAAKVAGQNPDKFQNIDLPPQDGTAALLRGQVEAASLYQPYADKVAKTAGFHVLYTDNQLTQATHGSYRVADFVAAKTSYIQAHPKIIEAFVKALSQGAALYQGDPAKAASLSWKQDGAPDSSAALGLLKTSVYPTLSQQLTSAYLGKPGSPGELGSVIENVASFEKQLGTTSTTISLSQAQQLLDPDPAMSAGG